MNKIKVSIWGREFILDITYDCYHNESVLNSQKEAVIAFANATSAIDSSLNSVKTYCLSENR